MLYIYSGPIALLNNGSVFAETWFYNFQVGMELRVYQVWKAIYKDLHYLEICQIKGIKLQRTEKTLFLKVLVPVD